MAGLGITQVVLGSMERAAEYQQLLASLKETAGSGVVHGEMVDRVLDNGKHFAMG